MTILTVRLLLQGTPPCVGLELTGQAIQPTATANIDDGQQSWSILYDAFRELGADPSEVSREPTVPESVVEDLRYRLNLIKDLNSRPIWLKLARPYGFLGTAPWERQLRQALGRPVLRLPDFPKRPADRKDIFECAILVDPDPETAAEDVVRRVRAVAEAILKGSSRIETRVHVFPSGSWIHPLRNLELESRINVHDSHSALTAGAAAVEDSTQKREPSQVAAWLHWISATIQGRNVDAVFLICRARETETGAEIVVANSPSPYEKTTALVGLDLREFGLILDRAGAWSAGFIPVDAVFEWPVSFVADGFAHLRPGAVLYHSLRGVESEPSLLAACQLLFSGKSMAAPELEDGFLYCHPSFVKDETLPAASEFASIFSVGIDLAGILADQASLLAQRAPIRERISRLVTGLIPLVPTTSLTAPPSWIGATQRFLESAAFDEIRKSAADVLLSSPLRKTATADTASSLSEQTKAILTDIQKIVENFKT